MGLTYKKTDKLERMFQEFAIDPDLSLEKDEKTPAQLEAEKFIEKEKEQLEKKARETEKK